ncbi:MAG: HisA/HisF-related TIM barrel protein [Sulfurifustis sp.]
MQLIPVIDLLKGQVVHARAGNRRAYQPLQSPLGGGSDPVAVVQALLGLHPFRTFYIADLDAIQRRGDNATIVRALQHRFPQVEWWLDAGFSDANAVADASAQGLGHPVMGSETLADSAALLGAVRAFGHVILSLDFKHDAFLGPADVLASPSFWPERVIVMTLARVGTDTGPDFARLRQLCARDRGKRFYAAGGVRGPADLEELERIGVAGVLLATALHTGRLPRAILAGYD